mmetsp:Transcript_14782/g.30619  ORF Transcript_14782/g.30619 Transcript_14782/m.30619 type:complete len:350 (-) Transcript_14782:66-1115(-)
MEICSILEEGGATGCLIASDESNTSAIHTDLFSGILVALAGTVLVVLDSIQAQHWIVCVAALYLPGGNILDDILVCLKHPSGERRHYLLDGPLPLLSVADTVWKHGIGQMVEVMADDLEREENGHTQQVEDIMNSGSGKGTLQLGSIRHLTHRHDCVCYGSSDVGSHDEVNTRIDRNGLGTNQTHYDRGSRRRTLNQSRGQLSNHQPRHGVGIIAHQSTGLASSQHLGCASHEFQGDQEEVKEEESRACPDEDLAPFLGVVDAARLGDFSPSGISDFVDLFFVPVGVSEVSGSGGAFLARTNHGFDLVCFGFDGVLRLGGRHCRSSSSSIIMGVDNVSFKECELSWSVF